jgi:hypothetical protein
MALAANRGANPNTANNAVGGDKFCSLPEFFEFKQPAQFAGAPAKSLSILVAVVVDKDRSAKPSN